MILKVFWRLFELTGFLVLLGRLLLQVLLNFLGLPSYLGLLGCFESPGLSANY